MKVFKNGKIRYFNIGTTQPKTTIEPQKVAEEVPVKWIRIGKAARMLGVSETAVRYWCDTFGLPVGRNNHNDRRFTPEQFNVVKLVHNMRHVQGLKEWRIHQILREQKLLPGTRGRKKTKTQFI